MALAWVAWEAWHLFWLQEFTAGVAGVFVLPWFGPGIVNGDTGFLTFIVLPILLGVGTWVATVALSRTARVGPAVLGLGVLVAFGWALVSGFLALGVVMERLELPIFAVGYGHIYDWSPWGRWVFDAIALGAVALLAGFGPDTPVARRALWTGLLIVMADSAWRVGVALFSGQIPMLYRGLGAGDWVFVNTVGQGTSLTQLFVFFVFGLLAALFVTLFANLPNASGPHKSLVWVGLAVSGLWLGLQAASLYAAGLFLVMGIEAQHLLPMPEYPGMLAALRFVFIGVGAMTLGLAVRRLPDDAA